MSRRLSVQTYIDGILAGDRLLLSRAITLAESQLAEDQLLAGKVLDGVINSTGNSFRIGITGVPGVGKSTFIESLGMNLAEGGKKVAVLTVDPSSERTKGSILGDKTRMEKLSNHPLAYVRPSATGNSLGGVTRNTRQAILLCEAAGFELIMIETVGVGQSETAVRNMADFFLLLMLAGAGDELQGIKRGIMEMADAVLITKADGSNTQAVQQAKAAYQNALHLFPPTESAWTPPVMTCSALTGNGIPEVWQMLKHYYQLIHQNGFFVRNRQEQNLRWLHETVIQSLESQFFGHSTVKELLLDLQNQVKTGQLSALKAAQTLLDNWKGK